MHEVRKRRRVFVVPENDRPRVIDASEYQVDVLTSDDPVNTEVYAYGEEACPNLTAEQNLAIAVLQGDEVAALVLADAVQMAYAARVLDERK